MAKENLIDQIEKLLPTLIKEGSDNALSGVQLSRLLSKHLTGEKESSIRQYLTKLSKDPKSILTKRPGKNGYYRKTLEEIPIENLKGSKIVDYEKREELAEVRALQVEEKFRALYQKFLEGENPEVRSMKIEHTKGKKITKGLFKWKYPDLVLVEWGKLILQDDDYNINGNVLDMMNSLGTQSFRLISVELKPELRPSNYREYFFQCVSNSKWAHEAQLVVALDIVESTLLEELIRLGNSYGVKIISCGLTFDAINNLPDAETINKMDDEDFSELFDVKVITPGIRKSEIDWEQLSNLRSLNDDFSELFEWIAVCLSEKKAYGFKQFLAKRSIQENGSIHSKKKK